MTLRQDAAQTVAAMHVRAQREVGPHVRRISQIGAALGRPPFLVAIIVVVLSWIGLNLGAPLVGIAPADRPPFAWLQGAIALSALLMTAIVLITQNRMGRHIETRARLDLQINLLAEQKITKLIELVEELRRDMPNVRNRIDDVADEMKEPVDPAAMLLVLEKTQGVRTSHPTPMPVTAVAPTTKTRTPPL